MIVTKIKRNRLNYDVYIDEELSFTLTDEGLYKSRLKTGVEIEQTEHLNEIIREDEIKRCKNRALRIITDSPKSASKVAEKLKKENFSDSAISHALDFLGEYSFIDDQRLAESITKKAVRANSSVRQIKNSLYKKGIKKEDIEKAVSEVDSDQEEENAVKVAIKKYNTLKSKSDEEVLRKVYYTLSYKGFSYSACDKAMNKIKSMLGNHED